jgi:hypothetical protein
MAKKKSAKLKKKSAAQGELCWDFPSTNHGEEDGFADSLLEYFQGDHEKYIAREAIQNAVDARLDYDRPVQVVFEHLTIPVASIPGWEMLKGKMKACLEFVARQEKAEKFFEEAIETLKGAKIPVLKISDFNTNGLSGSDDDRAGNWYRLVRATGTSSPKGVAGGSFGIGKGAPIAASALRTVFYSSINDQGGAVFQGKARLVSHYNKAKDVRQGVGFYGIDGYKGVRNQKLIPPIFKRSERGTDIFIIGYKSTDDWKAKLIRSVLHNFWLTILHGDLEVIVKDGKEAKITKDNLPKYFEEYDAEDAKFFFAATTSWTQKFEQELKHLGKVVLFVKKQDGFPGKVMMARKPKMLVQERAYRVLREPYAGVFLAADDRGNQLLRDLEPPAHDNWDRNRATNGWAALKEIDEFIKASLKSMGDAVTSEPQDIPGLDKYLPDSEERDYLPQQGEAFEPTELESFEESGREIGASKAGSAGVEAVMRKSIVTKKVAGKVRPQPPGGPGKGKQGRPTGNGDGTEDGVRINTANISFRSFIPKSKDGFEYNIAITGREACEGAICLVAVGDDNSYAVDITSAKDLASKKEYEVSGPMIKGLAVESGKTIRLAVKLGSKKKYALGIENYEG